jgi:Fe-S-cluster-containing hydrogenase component 2
MKKVYLSSQVDEKKCIGDGVCENVCPTGAIRVIDKKARVEADKCAACFKCLDACGEGAIHFVPRSQPLTLSVDPEKVDQVGLRELCQKAHLDPEEAICLCTSTRAAEVAAAILKGAKSPEEVTLATGIRTSCGMWCMAPILRLLRAHGLPVTPPKGFKWYDTQPALWNVSKEVELKYPQYRIGEDKRLFHEGIMDNLVSLLKERSKVL